MYGVYTIHKKVNALFDVDHFALRRTDVRSVRLSCALYTRYTRVFLRVGCTQLTCATYPFRTLRAPQSVGGLMASSYPHLPLCLLRRMD